MAKPLRIGVIGLGRRWRARYRPALRALAGRLAVAGVYDQVQGAAAAEARRLRCEAAGGPTALLERDDLDAVLLADRQWFGWWPLEVACRFRKPVYCGVGPEGDGDRAEQAVARARDCGLPVMAELLPRLAAGTERLRRLLDADLGPARHLVCEVITGRAGRQGQPAAGLLGPSGLAMLDWCAAVLGSEPVAVAAAGTVGECVTACLEFDAGRTAVVTYQRGASDRPRWRLRVVAERGAAVLDLPGRLRWALPDGRHAHALRPGPRLGALLLDRFHQALHAGQPPTPGLDDVARALRWLRAAETSHAEGRRVAL